MDITPPNEMLTVLAQAAADGFQWAITSGGPILMPIFIIAAALVIGGAVLDAAKGFFRMGKPSGGDGGTQTVRVVVVRDDDGD